MFSVPYIPKLSQYEIDDYNFTMSRITKIQKLENQKHYDEIVLNLFLAEGHEALTYARIAQEIGISLTTLQGYYPTTRAIRSVLHQPMLSLFMSWSVSIFHQKRRLYSHGRTPSIQSVSSM
ncbi:hypothetical protein VCHA54P496_60030 [Vibrio chagasii]|nr:hypothetical protein VCHA54P495_50208 [Vibrio chagasii]CAH7365147.1 hypothetical protein VCHA54P496_60030 [Vibrio chagasii]CAH7463787.1 hypothetical protein VCHA54P486_40209 [Vibrio chagasii]